MADLNGNQYATVLQQAVEARDWGSVAVLGSDYSTVLQEDEAAQK